jgi:hypothetical protein
MPAIHPAARMPGINQVAFMSVYRFVAISGLHAASAKTGENHTGNTQYDCESAGEH